MAERWRHNFPHEGVLPFLTFCLLGLGLVMVFSASSELAQQNYGDSLYFFKRQCFSALVGIMFMLVARRLPYQAYRKWVYPLLGLVVGLLVLVLVLKVLRNTEGASRWLRWGGFSFQPSELAKLALVIYLAYSLEKKGEQVRNFSTGYLPHLIVSAILIGLVMPQPDMGMAVILGSITAAMLFVGGARLLHLGATALAALPLMAWAIVGARYRLDRVLAFLNPWDDPLGRGFQIVHSFFALGSGGLWGAGIGAGKQKLFYLPEPHTDFIFAVLGEELGFVGVCVILCLYFLLLLKAVRVAVRAPDRFGYYLGMGVAFMVGLPVAVHLGVVLGLMPTKGMALPFMSYGGSSLLANLTAMGILLNIQAQGGREAVK